jgi:uncharacterized protein (TIGR00661 family)
MKILYGLPSEGMGHATRSKVIIQHLLTQNHDVQIVTSDRAFTFLSTAFPNKVHQIEGFHLAYNNAQVSVKDTILLTLKNAPKSILKNLNKYAKTIHAFNPDLVISDFESFTHLYATLHSKPLLSIDNMQVINRTKLDIEIPTTEKKNYLLAKNIIKAKVLGANHYCITSFFHPEISKKNTSYIPPIIRPEIINAKPTIKNHIVVYQTSTSQQNLISQLQLLPNENFIVYGLNKEETHKNVTLKMFSETEFIQHFASAKAVLSNGGFSFLSEAVYLQKPILSVPIANQFEQFVNASYIQQLGYGRHFQNFTADNIKAFLFDLHLFQTSCKKYKQTGNEVTFKEVNKILKSIA